MRGHSSLVKSLVVVAVLAGLLVACSDEDNGDARGGQPQCLTTGREDSPVASR